MDKFKFKPMVAIRGLLTIFIIYSFLAAWMGFIFQYLWLWFVVPVFTINEIPLTTAAILYVFISRFEPLMSLFLIDVNDQNKPKFKHFMNDLFKHSLFGLYIGGFGWIINLIQN